MNWSKIKNVLILALIIANISLIFSYKNLKDSFKIKLPNIEKQMIEKMKKNDIDLTDIKRNISDKSSTYKMKVIESKTTNAILNKVESFFASFYKDKNFKLKFTKSKDGTFKFLLKTDKDRVYSRDLVQNMLIDLLDYIEPDFLFFDEKERQINWNSNSVYLEQNYNNLLFLDGYISLKELSKGNFEFVAKIFEIEEEYTKPFDNINFSSALYRLYSIIKKSDLPLNFNEVEIVYKIKSQEYTKDLTSGVALPFYRFKTEKKEYFLVKAQKRSGN